MISGLNKDHLFGTCFLSEIDEVEESGFGEFLNGNITEPDEELLLLFFIEARETPIALRSIESNSRIEVE